MLPVLHALAPTAASSLVAAAWQSVALATLVALSLRLLPNLSASVRSAVWTIVLAVVALLPFAHSLLPGTAVASTHAAPIHIAACWSVALIAVWGAFSLLRVVQLVRSALHLRNLSRRATPIDAAPELKPLLQAGRRSAQLCLSREVDRPSVAGFLTPRILLPTGLLARLSPAELEQILLHEMEHLKRGDDWINLAQKLALAVFPLNPALLFIERRLCLERELACDDGVLRATRVRGARKAYANCLANLAEHSLVRRGASLALAAWERRSELARRVHRILRQPANPMGRRQTFAATTALVATLLGGAATLAHAPELVSFTPIATSEAHLAPLPVIATPAAFNNATAAKVVLTRATIPTIPAAQPALLRTSATLRHTHPLRAANFVPPAPSQPFRAVETAAHIDRQPDFSQPQAPVAEGWIVLTRWTYVTTSQPQQQNASRSANQPEPTATNTYAAVPTPNGWLIFEL